jgi:hypothetical protein
MPWLEPDQNEVILTAPMGVDLATPKSPSLGEVVTSAFSRENVVVNLARKLNEEQYPIDPSYSPYQDERVAGTKYGTEYADKFSYSYSRQDTDRIIADIEREERDNQVLNAGGFAGFAASVVAGTLDPTILMPGGAIYKSAKGGYSAIRSSASIAAAAAGQIGAQEAALQGAQELRTGEESMFNIATGTLLSAFLGAGAAKILGRGERKVLERALEGERKRVGGDIPPPAGAATTDLRTGELKSFVPSVVSNAYQKGLQAIEKVPYVGGAVKAVAQLPEQLALKSNPMLRMLTSESLAARRGVADLVSVPLETLDNAKGIPTSKFGVPLETDVKLTLHEAQVELYDAANKAFTEFRFGDSTKFAAARSYLERKFGKSEGLTYDEFLAEVDTALRNGDVHPIPQVQALAAKFRKWFDTIKDTAKALGIEIGDDVLGAKTFAPRVYDKQALTTKRPEFIQKYVEWRTGDQAKKNALRDDLVREWDILMRSRQKGRKLEGRSETADRKVSALENRLSERGMEAQTTLDRNMKIADRGREARAAVDDLKQFIADLKEVGDTAEIRDQIKELEQGVKELEANSNPITLEDLDAVDKAERDGILVGPMRRVARILTGKTKSVPKPPQFWKWIAKQGGVKDDGGDLFSLVGENKPGLFKKDGLQWDDLQTVLMENFPELRAKWEREGLAEDFADEIHQFITDSAAGNEPEWFLASQWKEDDRFVYEWTSLLDNAAGQAGVEFKSMNDVADFMRGGDVAGVTLDDLDRISADLEAGNAGLDAFVETDGMQQRIAIRQQTIELFKDTVAKARKNLEQAKVKGRINNAVLKESGNAVKRNLGRLGILNERAAKAQNVKDLLAQAQEVEKAVQQRQLEKIEDILNRWEGKSAADAKSAMKRRGETDANRTAEQKGKQPRLGSADKAIARAVKRIIKNSDLKSPQELAAEAEQTVNQILSTPDGRLPKDEPGTVNQVFGGEDMGDLRGSLNARKLPMPDNDLAPFLVRNPVDYTMRYLKQSLSDLGMVARFGDTEGTTVLKEIADDYDKMIREATTEKRRVELQKEKDKNIRDFAAMRDRIKGTYGFATDAFLESAGRVAESLKDFNVATLGGGFGLAQIADFAGVVYRYGLTSAFNDAWVPFFRRLGKLKDGGLRGMAGEWQAVGVGAESMLQTRMMDAMDMGDIYQHKTPFQRTLRMAGSGTAVLSGITLMTDIQKVAMASAASNNILRWTKAVANGKASDDMITKLAAGGIDPETASRIWQNFEANGGNVVDGAMMPNLADWSDKTAARRFQAAVLRDVEIGVMTPGQEKPLFLSSPLISLFGQFKTFIAAANTRILLANLQRRDANALSGLVAHVTFGMMTYAAYTLARGGEFHERPQDWIKEGFDRSGALGWFGELNNIAAKATGGQSDIYRLIGADKPLSRYMSRGLVGNLLGPTYGLATDASQLTYATATGEWTESDTDKLRRLIPFQNLFYLRQLFDEVERNGNATFGIEPRAGNER